jgi:aminopeptidase 2
MREGLPKTVKPIHYKVNLTPNFNDFYFTGKVSVRLDLLKGTKAIVANAHELDILSAKVHSGGTSITAKVFYHRELQTVSLELDHVLTGQVEVEMMFKGFHNDQMAGFYRSSYKDLAGNSKFMMVTQFQATDCRRCFPCWDEPDFKATFDIVLEIPKDLTGLSNMNILNEIAQGDVKTLVFQTTPLMSTYLLAICVGEFEYVEAIAQPKDSHPIVCRLYTSPGQKHLGKFALDICKKSLEFYSTLFGIPYPLTKMDNIAIPDFGLGAM